MCAQLSTEIQLISLSKVTRNAFENLSPRPLSYLRAFAKFMVEHQI